MLCLAKIATFSYVLATLRRYEKRAKVFLVKCRCIYQKTLEIRFGNTHRLLFFLFCIKIARILEQDAGDFYYCQIL